MLNICVQGFVSFISGSPKERSKKMSGKTQTDCWRVRSKGITVRMGRHRRNFGIWGASSDSRVSLKWTIQGYHEE